MTLRVLLVDDQAMVRVGFRMILESEDGIEVAGEAEDGAAAVAAARRLRPDVVLMDIQMPGMSGLDLTRQLKADPATRDIAIIAVTAYAMKGDREKAHDAGCDAYVTKPIDKEELRRIVSSYYGTG
jgi:CheY-like chemotaxis protein